MTFDDLNETLDDMEVSGDTPFRVVYDGEFFCIAAVSREHDGTVTLELEVE